jgi:integrase
MPSRDKSRGTWRAQVRHEGKIYRKDFRTKREAEEWETRTKTELKEGGQAQTRTGTASANFFNQYLDYAKLAFTEGVYKEKKTLVLRFLEMFGNVSVHDVTPEMVHQYLQKQAQTRSAYSANRDRKNLLAMWNWGLKILDLPRNPVAKMRPYPHERGPQHVPRTEDVLKLLAAATPEERVFLQCYLQTGARRGEIFRWTWSEDVNFEKREVRLGTRKTRDGSMEYQWLPMSDELYEELWWWWKHKPIKDTPHVFVSTQKHPRRHYGKPYTERRWFMETLCKRARVKPFGFHALRRYVASVLADTHKVSAKTIQRILRHKHLSTTERYIQNLNKDLKSIVNLLGTKSTQEEHPKDSKGLGNEP